MLHDDEFSSRAKVDRYGRKLPKNSARKELARYYRIKDEEHFGSASESDKEEEVAAALTQVNGDDDVSEVSSDESSLSSEEEEETEEEVFGFPAEQGGEGEGVPMGEPSSRLAVVNLDWDNIRAADLLAVFSSFTPGNGRILKVAIYPSEFGKERMDREEMEGPPKEIFGPGQPKLENEIAPISIADSGENSDEANDDDDETIKKSIVKEDQGQEFNPAKLRRYQLERLRYYYAVLTCSSTLVAQSIYDAVDGTEYLTTANFFDLRFIPDDVDFSADKPRDTCESIPDGYRPNEFVTDALQHSKVKLTWDADDNTRKEVQKRAFTGSRADIDENDLKAYLGSDSSDDDRLLASKDTVNERGKDTEGNLEPKLSKKEIERQKMRALLGLSEEATLHTKRKLDTGLVGGLQVTFSSGISGESKRESVFENEPEREETTVQKYIRKEKERKSRRKEELKNRATGSSNNDRSEAERGATAKVNAVKDPSPLPSEDLGFSDPFFADPSAPTKTKKVHKHKSQKSTQASTSPLLPSTSLAELELLTLPDEITTTTSGKPVTKDFDMKEIALAEKVARRSESGKKKRKLSRREKEAVESMKAGGGDDFEMNVQDPRFQAVFERAEFAIDPSHARFKATDGMKMLLDEGRRKRKRGLEEGAGEGEKVRERVGKGEGDQEQEREQKMAKAKKKKGTNVVDDEVQTLINRVKRTNKK